MDVTLARVGVRNAEKLAVVSAVTCHVEWPIGLAVIQQFGVEFVFIAASWTNLHHPRH